MSASAASEMRGYSIRTLPRMDPIFNIKWFIERCKIAKDPDYWRSQWYGLLGLRMEMWLNGLDRQKVCDLLQIPRKSLDYIDKEIRKDVRFPVRAPRKEKIKLRKMKAGVAANIARRWQYGVGYKHNQVLRPAQYSGVSVRESLIVKEGTQ